MGEVTAVQQIQTHHRIAGLEKSVIDSVVGWSSRQGLNVYVDILGGQPVGGEDLGASSPRKGLDDIGVLDPFVVARVGVSAVFSEPCGLVKEIHLRHAPCVFVRISFGEAAAEEEIRHSSLRCAFRAPWAAGPREMSDKRIVCRAIGVVKESPSTGTQEAGSC